VYVVRGGSGIRILRIIQLSDTECACVVVALRTLHHSVYIHVQFRVVSLHLKVKLSFSVIKYQAMTMYGEVQVLTPRILNLGT
jgi:hypothetical protein